MEDRTRSVSFCSGIVIAVFVGTFSFSDYRKEYERIRDDKLNAVAEETADRLGKIKVQGPGDVVHLSGLVSELSSGRELSDVYSATSAHNESSEEEGEEDGAPQDTNDNREESDFNDFVAKRRDTQQQKGQQ